MTQLFRLEADDTTIGGIAFRFPSGKETMIRWQSQGPIVPTLDAAKKWATTLVQYLLDNGMNDDLYRTNISSVVAAIQKHLSDWNDVRARALHADAGHLFQ